MTPELIETDPDVMMGTPVVSGTRITVVSIPEKLAAGETIEQLLDAHPRLTREGVHAALAFAARSLRTWCNQGQDSGNPDEDHPV